MMACEHKVLMFGSGDYYVFCKECAARWGRLASDRPEYGEDKEGRFVGCAPNLAIGQPTGERRKIETVSNYEPMMADDMQER
jgi:hypothetical protein